MSWWFFGKKTNAKALLKKVNKKNLKDWEKRLDSAVRISNNISEVGENYMMLSDDFLRCEYNKNRSQDNILKDIKKRFKGCTITMINEVNGTNVEIRWDK